MNRNFTEDLPAAISIAGFAPASTAGVTVLKSDSIYDENSETEPEWVKPVTSQMAISGAKVQVTFARASITRIQLSAR